jgi:zinc finger protein
LGGVLTTVEGLLEKIEDHFRENNPFVDSDKEFAGRIAALLQDLKELREGKRKFTLILIDPLSHSFIANPFLPSEDPRVKIESRPRTHEENEELGLNDIKVDNYSEKKEEEEKAEPIKKK